jgi:DNA-binding CsgD family transcriptional regulator/CheY-like chemotaxis protein
MFLSGHRRPSKESACSGRQCAGPVVVGAGLFLLLISAVKAPQAEAGQSTAPQPAIFFYVAADGNDAWSGRYGEPNAQRTDGPFRTIARARDVIRALKAGASGYITKQSAPEELVQAIRKIVGGGKYVSAALAEELATELDAGSGKLPHETLSDREFQVMRLIAAGKKSSEIAEELSVTTSTVNTYRMRIFEKMKMQSNVELARYALEHGLIE